MPTKFCKCCGKEFESTDLRKIYCSKECNWKSQNDNKAAKRGKHKVRNCTVCDKEFVPDQARGVGRTTCSDECWKKHRSQWAANKRKSTPSWNVRERKASLKKHYNVSQEEYWAMYKAQNGCCAICNQKETNKVKGTLKHLAVDHNHETGKVRALLCSNCNRAIGLLGDSAQRVMSAFKYLEKFSQ